MVPTYNTGMVRAFLFLTVLSWLALPCGALAAQEPPEDPFADQYEPHPPVEVGTAAGQFRGMLGAGLAWGEGPEVLSTLTLEVMTDSFVGIRLTSSATLLPSSELPGSFSLQTGVALHVLPYRPVDLGVFLEGGVLFLDPLDGDTSPVTTPGAFFEVALSTYWFVHLEGRLPWAVVQQHGGAGSQLWWTGVLSVGCGI